MCVKYGQIYTMGLYVRPLKVRLCPLCVRARVCVCHLFSFLTCTVQHGQWSTDYVQVIIGLCSTGYHQELQSLPLLEQAESFVHCNPITLQCPHKPSLPCCMFIQVSHSAVHRTLKYIRYIWVVTAQCVSVCHIEKTVTKINKSEQVL
jgi:hypothetical protein